MDVLILCKDCGEQFGNDRSNNEMNRIKELSNSSKNVSIQFSECMGICPIGKICTIRLLGNKANSMEKITLLPKEICNIILTT